MPPIFAPPSHFIQAAGDCWKARGARVCRPSYSSAAPTIGPLPRPASRWWPAPVAEARMCRSSLIQGRIMNSIAPIRRSGCVPGSSIRRIHRAAHMAAQIRRRGRMHSSACRSGWHANKKRRAESDRRGAGNRSSLALYQAQCKWPHRPRQQWRCQRWWPYQR